MAADIAAERMARLKKAGIDNITFAWAGGTEKGQKHYYRVQGPTFLIEYDNTQNDGNHIHSVWRDFNGDFGRDLLREHLKAQPHALTLLMDSGPVTVFTTRDQGLLALAKSLLESAGIDYAASGKSCRTFRPARVDRAAGAGRERGRSPRNAGRSRAPTRSLHAAERLSRSRASAPSGG